MPAATKDLIIEQGATFRLQLRWKDKDNNPYDLTNYTARMQIRRNYTSDHVIAEFTTENGKITLGGVAGTIVIEMAATETAQLKFSEGVYDLEMVAQDGFVTRLLQGKVTLNPEATRDVSP